MTISSAESGVEGRALEPDWTKTTPWQFIKHFLRPYWKRAALALFMTVLTAALDLLVPRLIQRIVDQGIATQNMPVIINTALQMIGVSVLEALFTIANTLVAVRVAQHFGANMRAALFHKIQGFSFGNLDRWQTGQLLVRLTSDVNQVQMILMAFLRIFTRAPLLLVGSVIMMTITNARLAAIMLVLLPLEALIVAFFVKVAPTMFEAVQRKLDNLNTVLQENLAGVRVVKAFVRNDHEAKRFNAANLDLTQQLIKVMQLFAVIMPSLLLLVNLTVVAALWLGGVQVDRGTMTVGEVVAVANYLMTTIFPLTMLGTMIGQISSAQASLTRIMEVMHDKAEIREEPRACALTTCAGRVAMDNVTFAYNGDGQEAVLRDINLRAEPGQTIAILGATGSGKSSLVNLIPRFYDADEGRVTLDGEDVRELTLNSLRTRIGMSLQEAVLFSGTIRDNIRYGRPEASDEEVVAAAKAAQAHDFITSFPEGYDTQLGQRGVNLSGGQKQRLAIARALLVRAPVLILDDSTSSVDIETEARIQEALREYAANRVTIVIAQRISTVLTADRIIVLDQGSIAAEGTHAELMASSPIYREIYDSQLGNGMMNHG